MIVKFLSAINDTEDYLDALDLMQEDGVPTAEVVERLLALYTRYLPEDYASEPDMVKLCLAADLLLDQAQPDGSCVSALDMPKTDVEMLIRVLGIVQQKTEPTAVQAGEIVGLVRNGEMNELLRIVLARSGLDMMAGALNYVDMREQIVELAGILSKCSADTLDRASRLLQGVKFRCRMM